MPVVQRHQRHQRHQKLQKQQKEAQPRGVDARPGGTGSGRLDARQEPCRERRAGRGRRAISNNRSAVERQRRVPDMTCSKERLSAQRRPQITNHKSQITNHKSHITTLQRRRRRAASSRGGLRGSWKRSVAYWAPVWQRCAQTASSMRSNDHAKRTGAPRCQR
jgi:hypothetical protein